MISVIIPVLNEEKGLVAFLKPLQKYRDGTIEVILVDGGSDDSTLDLARPLSDIVQVSNKGRANQMNVGAKAATGDIFLFLHADTYLPYNFPVIIEKHLAVENKAWGRFDVVLSGRAMSFRLIELFMNLRSRLTGIATGDQAIFVIASVFHGLNGYDNIPLMEDIALSKKLNKITRPACLKEKIITSSRRWEKGGIWNTVFLMWRLRFTYYFGADPSDLARKYV